MTAVEYLKMLVYIGAIMGGFLLFGIIEVLVLLCWYKLKEKIKEKRK